MKSKSLFIACTLAFLAAMILAFSTSNLRQNEDPWTPAQLMAPADLANAISNPADRLPFIFCIGPGAVIKGSIDIGPAKDNGNLVKLRQQLSKLPKNVPIVIYCGCCPFVNCPNIRPAFALLKEMKFTHPQLLNLEHNIKTDWIDKGYPVSQH
jgi:thiosulfate/3-mercaptopyruvate sulfurtransferase